MSLLSQREMEFVRVLQRDLPIVDRPFDAWARELKVTVNELLAAAEQFRVRRIMRRFSAVLRHRELGFDANAMGVWIVPPDRQDAFGAIAAGFPEVSHCYLRPSYAGLAVHTLHDDSHAGSHSCDRRAEGNRLGHRHRRVCRALFNARIQEGPHPIFHR